LDDISLSFRDYILSHSPEDSTAGDFIRETKKHGDKIPRMTTWKDLQKWLTEELAPVSVIEAAKSVWERYELARQLVRVEAGLGLTVAHLIELLQAENPAAQVIKFHSPNSSNSSASRVVGFSRVRIQNGDRHSPAIMLE
jgi:hypothetical protein